MRALRLDAYKSPPKLVDLPLPEPGPGQVRVRIAACGLNFADTLMIEGRYQERPDPPLTLGLELAGTVEALGPGTDAPAIGTRVAVYAGSGGLAEAGVFPADRCVPIPDTLGFAEAAGFQIAYGTSHLALTEAAAVNPGERLVVTGAAGGVGLTAVEIGAKMGAEVIAIARGSAKLDLARKAGASHGIDAETPDIRDQIKALGGADVVYDAVGGDLFEACFRASNPGARLLLIGFAGGSLPELRPNHMLVKNVSVIGFYWGGYLKFAPEKLTDSLATLFDWVAEGRLSPHVSHRLPLAQWEKGLDLLRTRQATGKVVIEMA